jgi:hypothetical protein
MFPPRRLKARMRLSARHLRAWWRTVSLTRILAGLGIAAGSILSYLLRDWLRRRWLDGARTTGQFFLDFSQNHPHLARLLHVLLNVIPDVEFLVLALAGLVYLMPSLIDRIEKNRALRIGVTAAFISFAVLTVIVNAIDREEESYTQTTMTTTISDQGRKLDAMNTTNQQILGQLISNKPMTEAERRENIEKALRNQYIASHESIDPLILAGNAMPPAEWMNPRLAALGEHWKVTDPKPIVPIIEEPPKPEPAKLIFSLWDRNASLEHPTLSQTIAPDSDGNYQVDFTFGDASETSAEAIDAWITVCDDCSFAKEPEGFEKTLGSDERTRHKMAAAVNPGANASKMTIVVKTPVGPWFQVAFHYTCKTCGKMAPLQNVTIWKEGYATPLTSTPQP